MTELRRSGTSGWRVVAGDRALDADGVIVAVPAPAAAELLRPEAPGAATELAAVEYASMALVTLAYRRADIELPRRQRLLGAPVDGRTIKASTFASQKWGWIAEENPDVVVLRTSVGRYGETTILDRDDTGLVDVSRHDLREATGLDATPWRPASPAGPTACPSTRWATTRAWPASANTSPSCPASPSAVPRTTVWASRPPSPARTRPSSG